ncbi:kinase-like domain-containing protein [Zychaea mexicana]|uniref:kinase-like domain-containing protein n=1 Tax=Zychaea mexicana TaxID=64656 RepID=UPI0022FE6EDE|nr:kinase-like domain-containing protein [Zychaea mexicana]KAI9493542.1 kinase-like domain-containing protein [Zychaea mexicana]
MSPPMVAQPETDTASIVSVEAERNFKQTHAIGPYKLLETLGKGEFGKVKLAQHVNTGQKMAVKMIDKRYIERSNIRDKVEREIALLKRLSHPSIIKLFDVIETERHIGMVMEYASGGELFEYIFNRDYLREDVAQEFFGQLISSVHYMHQKGVVHRDLKLENVLLLDDQRHIVITDFGFANNCTGQDDLLSTCCGSPCYAAPELLVGAEYVGPAVDIWSCGVVLYAMLCGFLPFDDHHNMSLLHKDMLETQLVFPPRVSQDARDLMRQMLNPNPEDRCKMETILAHPWLASQRTLLSKNVQRLETEAMEMLRADLAVDNRYTASLPRLPQCSPTPPLSRKRKGDDTARHSSHVSSSSSDSSNSFTSDTDDGKQRRRFTWSLTMRRGDRKRKNRESSQSAAAVSCTREHLESLLVFSKISDHQLLMLVLRVLTVLGILIRQDGSQIACVRRANDPGTVYGSLEECREVTFIVGVSNATTHGLRSVGMRYQEGQKEAYAFLCGKIMDMVELVLVQQHRCHGHGHHRHGQCEQ